MKRQPTEAGSAVPSGLGLDKVVNSQGSSSQPAEVRELRSRLMKMILDNEQTRKTNYYFPTTHS